MFSPQKKLIALLLGGLGASALPGTVFAHGAMEFPKARQYQCYGYGDMWNPGSMKSAACKAALENSPAKQGAFVNWNGYTGFAKPPHSQADARVGVPDGMLCTGNHPQYAGFNLPRADWTATTLQPDADGQVGMTYYYTARHTPSFIEFYINKKSVDPTKKALGWDDVELLKRFDIASGDSSTRHTVNVTIPADRTGKAIIFTRWQRIDPVGEGFYNCSDVNIKSRDGSEVPDEHGDDDNVIVSGWIDKGAFITSADKPSVGDKVRFRLMGGAHGDNLVDVLLPVTASNIANNKWVIDLGQQLNRDYSNYVQIGQQAADRNIAFNEQLPLQNRVFVSDQNFGYAIEIEKNAEIPAITLDRYTLDPIASTNTTYSYTVTGSSNKSGVSWQWKRVAGDSRITASPTNQARTQIAVAGGVSAGASATFELTGSQNGAAGKATLQVKVAAPQVSLSGPGSITAGKGAKYRAKANFDNGQGVVSYGWAVLKGGQEVAGAIDGDGNLNASLPAGDYLVKVSAEQGNGERVAASTASLKVTGADDNKPGEYETWKAGKVYTMGNTVSWKGVNYIARNWTLAEPGKGADWKLHNNAQPVEWQSTMVYIVGNLVTHQGKTWRASQWISANNEPGKSPLWKAQ